MISSRRLAREWALKILYQMDVGGASLSEVCEAVLERLRTEFVQRGSRNATGSTAELICLDYVTSTLTDASALVRQPFEKALTLRVEMAFSSAPCWQEACFEKAFKYRFKGLKLRPARLLVAEELEPTRELGLADCNTDRGMTDQESVRLAEFTNDLAARLPLLLAPEMRRVAREAVSALYARLPNSTTMWSSAADQQLLDARIRFNANASDRWNKVAQIVRKQTADWLGVGGFTVRLVTLTDQRRTEIDAMLSDLASGWKLDRQAAVDRNILRLAALEILFIPDIPYSVTINEAVELAKKFSTAESGRFVNGVLGAIALRIGDKQVVDEQAVEADDELIDEVTDGTDIAELDDLGIPTGTTDLTIYSSPEHMVNSTREAV